MDVIWGKIAMSGFLFAFLGLIGCEQDAQDDFIMSEAADKASDSPEVCETNALDTLTENDHIGEYLNVPTDVPIEDIMMEDDEELDEATRVFNGNYVPFNFSEFNDINRAVVGLDKNKFPDAYHYISWGTGLLIAPRLVLTVAHNGNDGVDVNFPAANASNNLDSAVPSLLDIPIMEEHDYNAETGNVGDIGIWVMQHPSNVALPYFNTSRVFVSENNMPFYGFGNEFSNPKGPLRRAECDYLSGPYNHATAGRVFSTNCGQDSAGNTIVGEGSDSGGPVFNSDLELVGLHQGSPGNNNRVVVVWTYQPWIESYIDLYKTVLRTGDFDGDGRDDLFYWNPNARGNWVDLSKGSVPDGLAEGPTKNWCAQELFIGDFDGNGREDLLCFNDAGNKLYIDYANIVGTFYGTNKLINSSWCNGEILVGDFNGDGLDDLHCRQDDGWRKVDLNNGLSSRFTGSDWQAKNYWCAQNLYVGDFNDDGRDDLLCWHHGSKMYIKYATSSGTFSSGHISRSTAWCGARNDGVTRFITDFNGDGADDLLCWNQTSNAIYIDYAGTGSFPFYGTNWSKTSFYWCADNHTPSVADISGDGKSDLVCYDDVTGKMWSDYYSSSTKFNGYSNLRRPNIGNGVWP